MLHVPTTDHGGRELKDWEENPTHNPTAVDEMFMASAKFLEELKDTFEENLMDFLENLFPVSPVFHVFPGSPVSPEYLPSLPLPSPQTACSSAPPASVLQSF